MNRMFAKTEKMKAATRSAMERLKAMPASELLAFGKEHADSDLAIFLTDSADDHLAEGKAKVTFTHLGEYRAKSVGIPQLRCAEHYEVVKSAALSYAVVVGNAARNSRIPKFDFDKISVMCGSVISPMLSLDTNVAA